jgi:AcrR family transcriptional regulator
MSEGYGVSVDPRARRSRDRLFAAVLELAASGRVDDVSVSEVARTAGVTRDTFYRHSGSVSELLTMALAERLLDYLAGHVGEEYPTPSELVDVLASAELALLRHIAELGSVYRAALGGSSAAPVRRALTSFLQENIEVALRLYPEIAPLPEDEMDDLSRAMIASYAASGTVGAIEVWLHSGDLDDPAGASLIIAAGAPTWWRKATGKNA